MVIDESERGSFCAAVLLGTVQAEVVVVGEGVDDELCHGEHQEVEPLIKSSLPKSRKRREASLSGEIFSMPGPDSGSSN